MEDVRTLRPHQLEALHRLRNGSVLAGGVGSGKSTTALAYYALKVCGGSLDRSYPMKEPKDLIVLTTAKKRDSLDWESEAAHYGLFRDPEDSYSHREFIVDSWNNIKKYEDRKGACFLLDEQRISGKGKWVKSFYKIAKANEWILLTATPADTWIDYIPVFVANGFYRNRTDFMESHVIWRFTGKYPEIRGFFNQRRLEKLRDDVLVHMPYEKHTVRHLLVEPVGHDEELFKQVWRRRWNVYEDQPLVDAAEMHRVARRVVNEDPSRLVAIEKLSAKHPRLIVFYNFDYELDLLRTLMPRLDIPVAEWNGHRHEPVPETERWLYLVQYQAGAEAWNCIATDATVYYSLTYSHKQFEQSQGRIDRLDSPYEDLYYYVLMSTARIDKLVWRALVAKRSFHEGRNVRFKEE